MALKDTWVDKVDGVDYVEANDVNSIAKEVIEREESIGEGNTRGIKGYWISAVGTALDQIVLSGETVRENVGKPTVSEYVDSDWLDIPYAVGDEFSVITPKDHYHLCGKIVNCDNGNRLTVEYYTDINWDAGDPTDNNDYSFFVPAKPDLGIIDVSEGGFATGYYTRAGGDDTHAEGVYTQAIGSYSHAEGLRTWSGYSGHAEGSDTKAIGKYAHAEGCTTTAKGGSSHSEGELTYAAGFASHAEGKETTTSGYHSHAEGWKTQAQADNSHAEGLESKAEGANSHAENSYNRAIGENSHAGGTWCNAIGTCSFAHGDSCDARSDMSVAVGYFTETSASQPSQFATGELNETVEHALFMVGNGASTSERSNAFVVKSQGRGNSATVSMIVGNTEITEAQLIKLLDLLNVKVTRKITVSTAHPIFSGQENNETSTTITMADDGAWYEADGTVVLKLYYGGGSTVVADVVPYVRYDASNNKYEYKCTIVGNLVIDDYAGVITLKVGDTTTFTSPDESDEMVITLEDI